MMYKPRPIDPRERLVFDFALRVRLRALDSRDSVLLIADSAETVASLTPFEQEFPALRFESIIINPEPVPESPSAPHGWLGLWQRYTMTDRWSRIRAALNYGSALEPGSALLMPAHDAIYTAETLSILLRLSGTHAKNGLPAAISPVTYHHHSAVPGAAIPQSVINIVSAAFARDTLFGWKVRLDRVQGFWGKMSLLPVELCAPLLHTVDTATLEDDRVIDAAIRKLGYAARAWWVADPALYRHAIPVFDRDGARRVFERTLHYSLHIPSPQIGSSMLNQPPGPLGNLHRAILPGFRAASLEAERLVAGSVAEIRARLAQTGVSWVDWGAYRQVVRVSDPSVEVWRRVR